LKINLFDHRNELTKITERFSQEEHRFELMAGLFIKTAFGICL